MCEETVILRGVMQTLTPRDGQTNWATKWEPSFLFLTPFSFLMLKAFVQIFTGDVKFSPFALSKWPCLLIKFCSARNYFFYCCSLCPHKCKNKCCALKKLWSEIPQIWTYTTYDLTAFCQCTLIILPGRNSTEACGSPRPAVEWTQPIQNSQC